MRSKFLLIALGTALAGCQTTDRTDVPAAGLAPINVPVVTSADYVFDAAATGGALAAGEAARLDGWFQGLGIGYGDSVYVDGSNAPAARAQVAAVASHYGMLVSTGAPVTTGLVQPGSVRVVVARRRAAVPGCPSWRQLSQPDWNNRSTPNFGCAVNSNLAAMVADPQDLIHGRDAAGGTDAQAATRAVQLYRSKPLTGAGGLQSISTKSGGK